MPGRDRTGPLGAGPMTGRAAGPCGDDTAAQFARRGSGGGRRRRGGRGGYGVRRGLGSQPAATTTDQPDVAREEAVDPRVGPAAAATTATGYRSDLLDMKEQLNQLVHAVHELGTRIRTLENGATA
jgi:hypothetical protein